LGSDDFAHCDATMQYIRVIDRAFDLLNSRNPIAKGFKAPLRPTNQQFWRPFVDEAKSYLQAIKLSSGDQVCNTNRKTGVIGLITALTSFCTLFDTLVVGGPLKYILGYKFSQDHIELFFCAIRGQGGWNNNPTARQFKAAYKRLLMHQNVKAIATGNCIPLETVELLAISSRIDRQQTVTEAESYVDQRVAINDVMDLSDHDYSDIPDFAHLSTYVENIVVYIAGFVVRKLLKLFNCSECKSALLAAGDANCVIASDDVCTSLLVRKSRGGLLIPSADVVQICKVCERAIRALFQQNNRPPSGSMLKLQIINQVLTHVANSDIFSSLGVHAMTTDPLSDHRVRLLKAVCDKYCVVGLYHAGKVFTQSLQGSNIRSVLSKTILFKGQ